MIKYDEELEDMAFSKDATALRSCADRVVTMKDIHAGLAFEQFFRLGQSLPNEDCSYFAWHGDGESLLLFFGGKAAARIRSLPDA